MKKWIANQLVAIALRIRGDVTKALDEENEREREEIGKAMQERVRSQVGKAIRVPMLKKQIEKLESIIVDRDITIRNLSKTVKNLSEGKD